MKDNGFFKLCDMALELRKPKLVKKRHLIINELSQTRKNNRYMV